MMNQVASQTEIGKNMLETVTLQRIPPVAARRYPLRRVITRPRPEAEQDANRSSDMSALSVEAARVNAGSSAIGLSHHSVNASLSLAARFKSPSKCQIQVR